MHTKTFNSGTAEQVTVNFNPDFSGSAVVHYKGKRIEIPAIVLAVGIDEINDALFALWEKGNDIFGTP